MSSQFAGPGSRLTFWGAVFVLTLAGFTLRGHAGDLNPPPGPVLPTGPILLNSQTSSLPLTISQPGMYILTSSFNGVIANAGITIAASNVTLDLGGYEVIGLPGSLSGITVFGSQDNIEIRNGIVRNWAGNGVDLAIARNCRIENVRAFANTGIGISVGPAGQIKDCVATSNQNDGFFAGNGSVITDCSAYLNFDDGFNTNPGVTIRGESSAINGNSGFRVLGGCTLLGCSAYQNGGNGFAVAESCNVTSCTAQLNGASGFNTGVDCKVEGCVSYNNMLHGILADNDTLIVNCVSSRNEGDGIQVARDSFVFGNSCDNNGFSVGNGAGVHATFEGNRIDSNNVTDNDQGIVVDRTGSVIIRNTVSKSQPAMDFVIAPGNDVGPIGSAATATSPWANIQF